MSKVSKAMRQLVLPIAAGTGSLALMMGGVYQLGQYFRNNPAAAAEAELQSAAIPCPPAPGLAGVCLMAIQAKNKAPQPSQR